MRYLVGLAVSIWLVYVSHGWVDPSYVTLPDAILLLVSLVSGAISAAGLLEVVRSLRSTRTDTDIANNIGRQVTVAVIGGLSLSLSLVVRNMGLGLGSLQACVLSLCGGALAWAVGRLLLKWRGFTRGSWHSDAIVAGGAAAGANMTLVWIYGLPALRFLAENGTWIMGMLGIVGFGVLGFVSYVGSEDESCPPQP